MLVIALAALYGVVGVGCIVWPRRLQRLAQRWTVDEEARHPALVEFIGSNNYVVMLRVVGVIAASASIALLTSMH
jgi:hypothetical protein